MTKPRALVGTIGQTTKLTDLTTLQAAEMEAMCRILEGGGYEAVLAQGPAAAARRAEKFPTGRECWDGEGHVDLVWIHQQTPNYMGGPTEAVCEAVGLLAKGLHTADHCFRLVVDNNTTMRHRSVFAVGRRKECEDFQLLEAELTRKVERGQWTEVGIPETADPDAGLPFAYAPITSTQLQLTLDAYGLPEEKTVDLAYIGTSRANEKKRQARLAPMAGFLDHPSANFSGSLFKRKCGFPKGWELMSQARAHLIVRDPGMDQRPLHRYLQALIQGAVPIVLNEPTPVGFIHSEELQDLLRVSTLEEGLELVRRRDELLPHLRAELDHWMAYDREMGSRM